MRNLLALVGLLVVVFGAVGWYCGWYKLDISRNTNGNLQIKADVDTHKAVEDSSAFFQKVGQLVSDNPNKSSQPTSAPVNTPGPVGSDKGTASPSFFGIQLKAPQGTGRQ